MPILSTKPPKKPKVNNIASTVVGPLAPKYTPGELPAETLQQLASRRLKYSLQTGRDDKGSYSGNPGFIEQRRLGSVADINAQRVASERNRSEGILGQDRNFAARGMGRSGLLGEARGRVEADALAREGSFARGERQVNLDATQANQEEDFNFANETSQLRQQGAAQAYNDWIQRNPNQGAQAATPTVPNWSQWAETHPWAKTPAQLKILRANYNKMVGA